MAVTGASVSPVVSTSDRNVATVAPPIERALQELGEINLEGYVVIWDWDGTVAKDHKREKSVTLLRGREHLLENIKDPKAQAAVFRYIQAHGGTNAIATFRTAHVLVENPSPAKKAEDAKAADQKGRDSSSPFSRRCQRH